MADNGLWNFLWEGSKRLLQGAEQTRQDIGKKLAPEALVPGQGGFSNLARMMLTPMLAPEKMPPEMAAVPLFPPGAQGGFLFPLSNRGNALVRGVQLDRVHGPRPNILRQLERTVKSQARESTYRQNTAPIQEVLKTPTEEALLSFKIPDLPKRVRVGKLMGKIAEAAPKYFTSSESVEIGILGDFIHEPKLRKILGENIKTPVFVGKKPPLTFGSAEFGRSIHIDPANILKESRSLESAKQILAKVLIEEAAHTMRYNVRMRVPARLQGPTGKMLREFPAYRPMPALDPTKDFTAYWYSRTEAPAKRAVKNLLLMDID